MYYKKALTQKINSAKAAQEEEIIKIKIYNKDGSEASTCGNGLRCVGAFLYHKLKKTKFMIETMANIYEVKYIDNDLYQVRFNIPTSIKKRKRFLYC